MTVFRRFEKRAIYQLLSYIYHLPFKTCNPQESPEKE